MRLWTCLLIVSLLVGGFFAGYSARQYSFSGSNSRSKAATGMQLASGAESPSQQKENLARPRGEIDGGAPSREDAPTWTFIAPADTNAAGGMKTATEEPPLLVLPSPVNAAAGASSIDCPMPNRKTVEIDPAFALVKNHFRDMTSTLSVVSGNASSEAAASPADNAAKPSVDGAAPRYTNRRDIALDFTISRNSEKVHAVELWARRSRESDYVCVDRMVGNKSPFLTRLWSEGDYDFRLVFDDGSGKTRGPGRDMPPDIRICLDTTKPEVAILSPVKGPRGIVSLCYQATDACFDDLPICWEFSIDGVVWKPISENEAWIADTGVTPWTPPAEAAAGFHLRLFARDRAGNIAETRTLIMLNDESPLGQINELLELAPPPRLAEEMVFEANADPNSLPIERFGPPEVEALEVLTMPRVWTTEFELLPMPGLALGADIKF